MGARAAQDIPPAVRRLVLRRDGGRCQFPGCRHATFVDVHHIELREDGGSHEPDNLLTLCSAHHRALHRGRVILEGKVSTGLRFRHADGGPYGAKVDSGQADLNAKVFQALRNLEFRESEARRAIDEVSSTGGQTLEGLIRASLAVLTSRAARAG